MLTQKVLKELLEYDPNTGLFKWITRDSNRKAKSWFKGTITTYGYRHFQIKGKNYLAHRLAWLYMTGVWPIQEIDHINRIRDDNKWENLREVCKSINMQNQKDPHKNNLSGYLGVQTRSGSSKFYSEIKVNKGRIFLGVFNSAEDAHNKYLEAKEKYHIQSS